MPPGATWEAVDKNKVTYTVVNQMTNFGHEFVWHCHILGHEENDMMYPLVVRRSIISTWEHLLLY
jgi:FtsP/CotA-like multicopper oxidase with cupredoxin domain